MIKVLSSGLSSSIQDLGRFGYREYGVPLSGAMDKLSMELANLLLGNSKDSAVLEMTMIGATLQFQVSSLVIVTGADMSPTLNDVAITNNKILFVDKGDILHFGNSKSGLYCYLGVKDGFKTEKVLNSRSYYKGITTKNSIESGDILEIEALSKISIKSESHSKLKPFEFSSSVLEVYKGPEFDLLTDKQQQELLNSNFKVSKLYNRMAYQLAPNFENELKSILTGPVLPGTVQLTPSGKLIVLMRDCQTTGGYPRVLQFSEASINLLAQKKERDKISFKLNK